MTSRKYDTNPSRRQNDAQRVRRECSADCKWLFRMNPYRHAKHLVRKRSSCRMNTSPCGCCKNRQRHEFRVPLARNLFTITAYKICRTSVIKWRSQKRAQLCSDGLSARKQATTMLECTFIGERGHAGVNKSAARQRRTKT